MTQEPTIEDRLDAIEERLASGATTEGTAPIADLEARIAVAEEALRSNVGINLDEVRKRVIREPEPDADPGAAEDGEKAAG